MTFILLSVVSLVSLVLVAPAYVAADNHYAQALAEETQAANAVESSKVGGEGAAVQKVAVYMGAAVSLIPLSPQTIIEPIVSALPAGVTITSLSIGVTDQGIEASVAGLADTRDELIAFTQALQGVGRFSNVDLPVSYLAQDSNIDYSIMISVKATPSQQ